jgi:hypothetical protein
VDFRVTGGFLKYIFKEVHWELGVNPTSGLVCQDMGRFLKCLTSLLGDELNQWIRVKGY